MVQADAVDATTNFGVDSSDVLLSGDCEGGGGDEGVGMVISKLKEIVWVGGRCVVGIESASSDTLEGSCLPFAFNVASDAAVFGKLRRIKPSGMPSLATFTPR